MILITPAFKLVMKTNESRKTVHSANFLVLLCFFCYTSYHISAEYALIRHFVLHSTHNHSDPEARSSGLQQSAYLGHF